MADAETTQNSGQTEHEQGFDTVAPQPTQPERHENKSAQASVHPLNPDRTE
jgi:hypothetical protein